MIELVEAHTTNIKSHILVDVPISAVPVSYVSLDALKRRGEAEGGVVGAAFTS